jgi:hypothetical protein
MTLYVPHGVVWNQYSSAVNEALNPDNPAWARVTLGTLAVLAAPLAGAEELVGRSLANVPWAVENAGVGIGEHLGRASQWADQGEYGEATVDALGAVVDTSKGMIAGLSVGAPIAGSLESSAARTTVNTATDTLSTAAEEETVSVYHGSIKNGPEILEGGLKASKAPTSVSRDFAAAQDALVNHPDAIPGEGMIIESRIPASEFNSQLAPLERSYTGFYPNVIRSTEIQLRTAEHIDLFNQYICR